MTQLPDIDPLTPAAAAALASLSPDPAVLWAWLQPHITEDMLVEIAEADYGEDREAHLAALRQLLAVGTVPVLRPWVPVEVLALISSSEPDDPAWKPSSPGLRGHLMRLFCVAALLRTETELTQRGWYGEEADLVHQLVTSVLVLDQAAQRAALQLLAWRALHAPADACARPFFALAVLLLVSVLGLDREGSLLQTLCAWLDAEVDAAHARGCGQGWDVWLIGLIASSHDESWRHLTWEVLVEPPVAHPPLACEALEAIATRVICGGDGKAP